MTGMAPRYPQPYTLFHPLSGRPIYSGPNGEGGYSSPGINTPSWVMPDGRTAWYYPNTNIDGGNRVSLGLDRSVANTPYSRYEDIYPVLVRFGADPTQADIFTAIILAESGGVWHSHNNTASTGDDSLGWGQVNLLAHPQYRNINLYNIDNNVRAIKEISGNFTNLFPWTTTHSINNQPPAYKKFLRGTKSPPGPGSPPPVAEPGPPQLPPPHVDTPHVDDPSHGPIRNTVDRFINFIPSLFGIGTVVRDGVKAVLDPVADTVDSWIHILADDITGVIHYAEKKASDALSSAEGLVTGAEHLAEQGLHSLADFTGGLIRDAINEAGQLVRDAERLADSGLHSLANFTGGLIRQAIDELEHLIHDAESLADSGLHALANVTASLIRDAINGLETLVRDAENLASDELHALANLTAGLIRDAESGLRTLIIDAEHLAEDGLHALERDVIGPLDDEVRHLVDDVLGPAKTVLEDLIKAAEWIAWAALHPRSVFEELERDIYAVTPAELLSAIKADASDGRSLRDRGVWGVP